MYHSKDRTAASKLFILQECSLLNNFVSFYYKNISDLGSFDHLISKLDTLSLTPALSYLKGSLRKGLNQLRFCQRTGQLCHKQLRGRVVVLMKWEHSPGIHHARCPRGLKHISGCKWIPLHSGRHGLRRWLPEDVRIYEDNLRRTFLEQAASAAALYSGNV